MKQFYSQNQSPSATSPTRKTQLILRGPKVKVKESYERKKTVNNDQDIRKQLNYYMEQCKDLQQKYELSKQEIQKYQVMLDKSNQKRSYEKSQLQIEIQQLKKQVDIRSRSQLDMHDQSMNLIQQNGLALGTIVNEQYQRGLVKELAELRDKFKKQQEEIDTKNLQLDYLTKKLINFQSCSELVQQIKELSLKLQERETKLKEYEGQPHNKFFLNSIDYSGISKEHSNIQSTTQMSNGFEHLIPQSYIRL
ncbi:hypothetical protein pb186bvf_018303 [Paramecium bursaria]